MITIINDNYHFKTWLKAEIRTHLTPVHVLVHFPHEFATGIMRARVARPRLTAVSLALVRP